MEIIVKKPNEEEIATAKNWSIWSHEPAVFPWEYSQSENCLILEGSATVMIDDGREVSFGVGDIVVFPVGLKCTWTIHKAIFKHYFFE